MSDFAGRHHRSFFIGLKILLLAFMIAAFIGEIPLIAATWLMFMVAYHPIHSFKCEECGAHPYRINQEVNLFYPMSDGWDYFLHGPNLECPHRQSERAGRP